MKITVECETLNELRKMVDALYVLLPEDEKTDGGGQQAENAGQLAKRLRVDKDEILRMHAEGMKARAIQQATGYGYSTVCKVIQEARKR